MELNFEELFGACLSALIEQHGGSMETALDDITYINEDEKREAIKDWFGWNDDEDEEFDEIEFFPGDEGDLAAEDYIEENHLKGVAYTYDEYRHGYVLYYEED